MNKTKKLIRNTLTDMRAIASISIWEFAMMVAKGRIYVKIYPKLWLDNSIFHLPVRPPPSKACSL